MSSIAKRPDGRWRARYRDAGHHEHSKHFARKVDAQAWLDSVTTAVNTGAYVDPRAGRTTVGEYAAVWIERQPQLGPGTRSRYRSILRTHVIPAFGDQRLNAIDHSAVTAWVGMLSKKRAAPTVRHVHRVLHMILSSAVRDGIIARNAAADVKLPRARIAEKRYLTHHQVATLAEAAGSDGLIIRVLAYCGLRFGELAALRVRHIDPMRRRLNIEESVTEVDGHMVFGAPKSHQRRSVPIPPSLVDAFVEHCAGKDRDDLVFTASHGGVIWLRNWRPRVFDPAAKAAGLAGLTPHELRHTAASLAVSADANVKAVQRLLGHASAAMTLDIYTGLFDDDLDAVAERLDEAAANELRVRTSADFLRTKPKLISLGDRYIDPAGL
jgi:integrase